MTTPGGRALKGPGSPRSLTASWSRIQVSWSRRQKALAALVAVVLAGVLTAVIVQIADAGPAVIGPAATPPPVSQAAVTKGEKWVTGRADKLLAAVNADLGRLSAAERAGHDAAARAAGARLAADARAALAGPMPPVQATAYRSALNDLRQAGTDIAGGNFGKAGRLLATGTVILPQVTAAVNLPAPANPPAPVNDPNG